MDQRVQLIINQMKEKLHRKLPLRKLAEKAELSLSRLHHLFKDETGAAPAHYLHAMRMERAKELLETTSLSIEQITARVGLRDRSHFEREFKRECGLTPVQYRLSARLLGIAKKD